MIWNDSWVLQWYDGCLWNFKCRWSIITHEFKNRTIINWIDVWIITMLIPIPITFSDRPFFESIQKQSNFENVVTLSKNILIVSNYFKLSIFPENVCSQFKG